MKDIAQAAGYLQGKLVISPDVMKALREGTAVVALESTIISHGMPYPQVNDKLPDPCSPSNICLAQDMACRQAAVTCERLMPPL